MQFRDRTFINVAKEFAKNSYCKRLQVGAVLVRDDRILASAYNGTLPGRSNCCEENSVYCIRCGWVSDDCTAKICENCGSHILANSGVNKTKDEVLHAEQNLLMFCAKNGISTNNSIMYITHSPCGMCAKLIAAAGIKKVIYENEYRNSDGIKLLKDYGIDVEKYISKEKDENCDKKENN